MVTVEAQPLQLPAVPWKTRLALFLGSAVTDAVQRPDGTVNRRLLNLLDLKAAANPKPSNGVNTTDVTVDPTRNLWFRIFAPVGPTAGKLPVVVFFHGGGFTFLSAASFTFDAVCRRFAENLSAVIVSVEYGHTPERRYPTQYDDGIDVVRFLDGNDVLPENADLGRCFLAGDSAGGNIAHHVAVGVSGSELRRVRLLGLVSIQPFFGGVERTEAELRLAGMPLVSVKRTDWLWRVFLPDGSTRDHGAVNVSGPNAIDISGLDFPDTIMFVGGFDPLQDWQIRYAKWLEKSGKRVELIEYPNMFHAFYVFPELPESLSLIEQVRDFMVRRVSNLSI